MLPIKDTVTIVTGSSSGIGAATVRMLAENGGHVVINYSKSAAAAVPNMGRRDQRNKKSPIKGW